MLKVQRASAQTPPPGAKQPRLEPQSTQSEVLLSEFKPPPLEAAARHGLDRVRRVESPNLEKPAAGRGHGPACVPVAHLCGPVDVCAYCYCYCYCNKHWYTSHRHGRYYQLAVGNHVIFSARNRSAWVVINIRLTELDSLSRVPEELER